MSSSFARLRRGAKQHDVAPLADGGRQAKFGRHGGRFDLGHLRAVHREGVGRADVLEVEVDLAVGPRVGDVDRLSDEHPSSAASGCGAKGISAPSPVRSPCSARCGAGRRDDFGAVDAAR